MSQAHCSRFTEGLGANFELVKSDSQQLLMGALQEQEIHAHCRIPFQASQIPQCQTLPCPSTVLPPDNLCQVFKLSFPLVFCVSHLTECNSDVLLEISAFTAPDQPDSLVLGPTTFLGLLLILFHQRKDVSSQFLFAIVERDSFLL